MNDYDHYAPIFDAVQRRESLNRFTDDELTNAAEWAIARGRAWLTYNVGLELGARRERKRPPVVPTAP